ncbi:hypothetical protein CR513_25609, partial [Mucuna pruriens]
MLRLLEERLNALEGAKQSDFDAIGLCLVPNIVIPPKFELPTFDKYGGTTCPKSHLTMYCRKMAPHAHDDALLIHFFQESLTGMALRWYLGLKRERVQTWRSLAERFLDQYKYNMDMALNHFQLQNMVKGERETFKGYAQRWRELAAHIQPPLSKNEMRMMFIDTLHSLFYGKMVGNMVSNFSDLVLIEERIEAGMRTGKIVLEIAISHPNKFPNSEEEEAT